MKLTNYTRDAFVDAVMNDVPEVDYAEQIEALIFAVALRLLPEKVRAAWDDPNCKGYIKTCTYWTDGYQCMVPAVEYCSGIETKMNDEERAEFSRLSALNQEQYKVRKALHSKIKGVAYGCTTRKSLVNKLPEFEKYLPADPEKTANLPALANVVTDFIKAGWPKEKAAA